MNPRVMGLEAFYESQHSEPNQWPQIEDEFKDGLNACPELKKEILPEILRYRKIATRENPTIWLEYLSMIGMFAPLSIRDAIEGDLDRLRTEHPGYLMILRAMLDRLIINRYGSSDPEAPR